MSLRDLAATLGFVTQRLRRRRATVMTATDSKKLTIFRVKENAS
jgi:hypothetical protein